MKLKDIILTANASLRRSKLRTVLTIVAIFIGSFTLTLTTGLGAGISAYVDKQVGNLGQDDSITITAKSETTQTEDDKPQKYVEGEVAGNGQVAGPGVAGGMFTASLTKSDIDELKSYDQIKDVQAVVNVIPDFIVASNNEKYKFNISDIGGDTQLDLAAGSQMDYDASENQLVIPLNYVEAFGFTSNDDAIGETVTIGITDANGTQHNVKGVIKGIQQKGIVSSSGIAVNATLRTELYDLQTTGLPEASKNKFQSANAKITGEITEQHVADVKSKLDEMGFTATTFDDQLGAFKTVINSLTYILSAFAIIALLAAGFGIINTLLMSVQERTKEIGLMKAMGMRSSRIFLLFSFEAVLIGFWGSLIGVVVAIGAGLLANVIASNTLLKDLPGFELLAFPLQSLAVIVLLIMAIAFLAGTLPARRAAKLNPIDALRYE